MSMESLSHATMGDLREDEEKWLKIFTKKSLITCVIGLLPGYLIFSVLSAFLPVWVGGVIWLALEIFLFVVTTIKLSVEDYRNSGGGQFIYMVLIKKIFRKTQKVYYYKGIFEDNDEEDND